MLNKVELIGRLGKDPELRYTQSGQAVASFSVATTERYKDKNNGQTQELTEWHNIVVWAKQAENCAKYLSKGKLAFIEGKIKSRSYDDKQTGQKKYVTEIVASNVIFLSPQSEGPKGGQQGGYQGSQPQQNQGQNPPNQGYQNRNNVQPQNNYGGPQTPNLDDIPF